MLHLIKCFLLTHTNCRIHHSDKLPSSLNVQLRINRDVLALPDSNGDQWVALRHHITTNRQLARQVNNQAHRSVNEKLRAILQLGPKNSFSMSRFLGLWRHPTFQRLCNNLCSTGVGRELFSIQVFSNLKESRVYEVCFQSFTMVKLAQSGSGFKTIALFKTLKSAQSLLLRL
jgi:hypothetical protein